MRTQGWLVRGVILLVVVGGIAVYVIGRGKAGKRVVRERVRAPRVVAEVEVDAAVAWPVDMLAAGATHTCALKGGQVWCWGAQADGAVGGAPEPPAVPQPRRVEGLPPRVREVAAGNGFSCALVAGQVWCWGTLGKGARVDAPARVGGLPELSMIAAGGGQACGIAEGGAVWCWSGGAAERVAGVPTARAVAVGGYLACVVGAADGAVWCWGDGHDGALGGADSGPVAVRGLTGVLQLSLGARFGCALLESGEVSCWGAAPVGDGTGAVRTVMLPGAASPVTAGEEHACAVVGGGVVLCWGDNVHGQLGDGSVEGRVRVVEVLDVQGSRLVVAGARHACAVREMEVLCWGSDSWRQLGRGGQGRPEGDVERVRPVAEVVGGL